MEAKADDTKGALAMTDLLKQLDAGGGGGA